MTQSQILSRMIWHDLNVGCKPPRDFPPFMCRILALRCCYSAHSTPPWWCTSPWCCTPSARPTSVNIRTCWWVILLLLLWIDIDWLLNTSSLFLYLFVIVNQILHYLRGAFKIIKLPKLLIFSQPQMTPPPHLSWKICEVGN